MKTNNTFSIHRFGLLFRQSFMYNTRMFAISLVGFCGGLFILLLLMQFMNHMTHWRDNSFLLILLFVCGPLSVLYVGTAFPGFRTREKSYNYLLNPASAFEKFLFEFFNRIILFLLVVPVVCWVVFNIEGRFAHWVLRDFTFAFHGPDSIPAFDVHSKEPETAGWMKLFIVSAGALVFTLPFTGATLFTKYPLVKTLFAVAVIFFFHLFLVYFFMEILEFKKYDPPRDSSILFIKSETGLFRALAIYAIVMNLGFIVAAYFKLREKEV